MLQKYLNNKDIKTIAINGKFIKKIKSLIRIELSYENLTGNKRKFGITGELGELLACNQLGFRLVLDSRSKGFDAIDKKGKRVEIKTRRSETSGLPRSVGRTGRFSKHKFDYALLVILNHEYSLCEIWKANYKKLLPIIEQNKRRNPSLSAFKQIEKEPLFKQK